MKHSAGPRFTVLTGATGFLGRELLASILARGPEEHVLAVVRPDRGLSGGERLAELLGRVYEDERERRAVAGRVSVVEADLSRDGLAAIREQVEGRRCRIIHGAASVSLDLPLEEARAINVGGTLRMLDLAVDIARVASAERTNKRPF